MRYIALLRGINVGGNNKVEMKKLKDVFVSGGFKNVETYINSGNILFDSDLGSTEKIALLVEEMIEDSFLFKVSVVVKGKEDLLKISKQIPDSWKNDTDQKTDILFLWKEFDSEDSLKYFITASEAETVIYVPGAILWNIDRKQYNKSSVKKFMGTKLYKNMTARNVNTVRKLCELIIK